MRPEPTTPAAFISLLEESHLAKKNIRSQITVTCYEEGQQVWRTIDTVEGDVSGSMIVPSVASARADLKRDWAAFDRILNTHGRTLSDEARGAIGDATAAIEGGNRWVATALLLHAATLLNDSRDGMPAALLVPSIMNVVLAWAGASKPLYKFAFSSNADATEYAPTECAVYQADCAHYLHALIWDLPEKRLWVSLKRVVLESHTIQRGDNRRAIDRTVFKCSACN